MKRKNVLVLVLMMLMLAIGLQACSTAGESTATEEAESRKKRKDKDKEEESEEETDETEESEEEQEDDTVADADMTVPGYALGEIPVVVTPKVPNLTIAEAQSSSFKMDATEGLRSVPGITIEPVVIKDGSLMNGDQVAHLDGNGGGQYTDGEKVLQTDGDGSGQYSDDNVVIQTDGDGGGQYNNSLTGVTLQTDGDGSGQYNDSTNDVTFQISADGSGQYSDGKKGITLMLDADGSASYYVDNEAEDIIIYNNGDGSGSYRNNNTGLYISNDGKGYAVVTNGDKEKKVKADPIEPAQLFEKLQPVPAVPPIEANAVLITLESGVLFDVDKYDIRTDAHEILQSLAKILKDADIKNFEIYGHTDSRDTDEYNQTLSENRANSVKSFLEKEGVGATITTQGFGESKPVATNDTAEGRQLNRRVEIVIPAQ